MAKSIFMLKMLPNRYSQSSLTLTKAMFLASAKRTTSAQLLDAPFS